MGAATVFVIDTKEMIVQGVIPAGHKMLEKLEDNQMAVVAADALGTLTGPQLGVLYNRYSTTSIKKFDTKAKGVERVWALLNSIQTTFTKITEPEKAIIKAQPIVERADVPTVPDMTRIGALAALPQVKKLRKVRDSKFKRLIAMLNTGKEFTLEQLAEQSGFTEASVIVRISVLRSDQHEWKMNIVKHKENDTWQLFNQDGSDLYHVKHAHRAHSHQTA